MAERGDAQIIELPDGYATYNIMNETNQVYLMDIYVKPEARRTYVASELANMVANEGKKHGCKEMLTTVIPTLNGSTISLKTILKYGFTLKTSATNMIVFTKEIV